MTTLYKMVGAAVGSGKTRETVRLMANKPGNYIYVAPTKQVIDEVYSRLTDRNPKLDASRCYSEDMDRQGGWDIELGSPLQRRTLSALDVFNKGLSHSVCLMTTENFLTILPLIQYRELFTVILDEGFDPVQLAGFDSSEIKVDLAKVLAYLPEGKDELGKQQYSVWPAAGQKQVLKELAVGREVGGYASLCSPSFKRIAGMVSSPIWDVELLSPPTSCKLSVIGHVHPRCFDGFDRVIVLCALFNDTPLYMLWEDCFDVKWKDYTEITGGLDDIHGVQGKHIKLGWMLPDGQSASKTKYLRDAHSLGTIKEGDAHGNSVAMSMINSARQYIAEHRPGERVLIHTNNFLKGIPLKTGEEHIPAKPHGLNAYSDKHIIISSACHNPDPKIADWITQKLGMPRGDVNAMYRLHMTYQAVGRTSIRVLTDNTEKLFIVPDQATAERLAVHFGEAELIGSVASSDLCGLFERTKKESKVKEGSRARRESNRKLTVTIKKRLSDGKKLTKKQRERLQELLDCDHITEDEYLDWMSL